MIRLYYDTNTGEITQKVSVANAFDNGRSYIDVDKDIKVYEWKVDLVSKKLKPSGRTIIDITPTIGYEQYLD